MNREKIRSIVHALWREQGRAGMPGDDASLFRAGCLDSTASVRLILALEKEFLVHFDGATFDIGQLDSVDAISATVEKLSVARGG